MGYLVVTVIAVVIGCAQAALTLTACSRSDFQQYLRANDKAKISKCMESKMVRTRLCNTTVVEGTILELPLLLLLRWKLACQPAAAAAMVRGAFSEVRSDRQRMSSQLRSPRASAPLTLEPYIGVVEVRPSAPLRQRQHSNLQLTTHNGSDSARRFTQDRSSSRFTDLIRKGLSSACSKDSTKLDSCFKKGFENARRLFDEKDPFVVAVNMTGGNANFSWALHGIRLSNLSKYEVVKMRTVQPSPKEGKPLQISSEWLTKLWTLELNATFTMALLTSVIFKRPATITMKIPNVRMQFRSDVWGEERRNVGIVRFYSEDKFFRLNFDPAKLDAKINLKYTPFLSSSPVLNEYIHMKFKAHTLKEMWPGIQFELGKMFQPITNGQAIPVVIEFILRRSVQGPRSTGTPRPRPNGGQKSSPP